MSKNNFQDQLDKFFLFFGAEQSLSEPDVEKLQHIVRQTEAKTIDQAEKVCRYVVEQKMMDWPEDEIVDAIRKAEL
jgi:hypothetical protein